MQTQLKYNKQASLQVTWALSYENSIPEATHSLHTGVVNWVEIFTVAVCMISTFQHQLGLMESTLSAEWALKACRNVTPLWLT